MVPGTAQARKHLSKSCTIWCPAYIQIYKKEDEKEEEEGKNMDWKERVFVDYKKKHLSNH